jgi:hypothetical protein
VRRRYARGEKEGEGLELSVEVEGAIVDTGGGGEGGESNGQTLEGGYRSVEPGLTRIGWGLWNRARTLS